jgi:cytochrome c-type biogenesis protein CcmE
MKGKAKVIVISFVVVASFLYLVLIGMKEGTMYYFEIAEFVGKMDELGQKKVRVNGEIVPKSMDFNSRSLVLAFTLKDLKGPEVLDVLYKGTPPDLIEQEGVTLVAEGSYNSEEKVFVAKQLLIKCPSKYEKKDGYKERETTI